MLFLCTKLSQWNSLLSKNWDASKINTKCNDFKQTQLNTKEYEQRDKSKKLGKVFVTI
jgi:hypothetical protein